MLILASQSTARQKLLATITPEFSVAAHRSDETVAAAGAEERALLCALGKAVSLRELLASQPGARAIISADTLFCVDNTVVGKPKSREEARRCLEAISGGEAAVVTATAVLLSGQREPRGRCDWARFRIRPLEDRDIEAWLDDEDATRFACAFAIQHRCAAWVEEFIGDYSTVAGLNLPSARHLLIGAINAGSAPGDGAAPPAPPERATA